MERNCKQCSSILEKKSIRFCDFCKEKKRKIKLEKNREYKSKNKDKIESQQKEYRKLNKIKRNEYRSLNKDSIREKEKEYKEKNKDIIKEQRRVYRINNRDKINKYVREKLANDPLFKLSNTIRNLIKSSFKKNFLLKSNKTESILGCTFDEFRSYIESKFDEKMSWDNHGTYWYIDHITPISWAECEEDVYLLNHYTNLQPLSKFENLSKNNRFSG
jgi:hypothetical protein